MRLIRLAAVTTAVVFLGGALAGCEGDDGRDGAPGPAGTTGPAGPAGTGEVLLDLSVIGRYSSGIFDQSAAEIVAYDPSSARLFVINSAAVSVDVLNLSDPSNPVLLDTIDASAEGGAANSVAVRDGVAAVAIEATVKTDPGKVIFYDTLTLAKISEVPVGALPDMLTFTPDGSAVLVANEGEPNEGDDRDDFIPGEEGSRIKDLVLDPLAFPDAVELQADSALGRLTVTTFDGDIDDDGQFEELYALGARSFSIWAEDGSQTFDSGADFERITAQRFPNNFNANNDENDPEGRSDNKGPEPEGVVLGELALVGDLGPEGLAFIPAADSPNGAPLLVVGNEVSGTTAIYQVDVIEL